jgi:hypothetical protein
MENLTMDERNLPRSIGSIEKQQILPADTLTDMLNHASVKKLANIIYYSFRRMVRQQGIRIYISDRTIEQEKNAGEMRLITDNQVSDSFIDYYRLCRILTGNSAPDKKGTRSALQTPVERQ